MVLATGTLAVTVAGGLGALGIVGSVKLPERLAEPKTL
jgi:hypothetical protein